MPEWVASPVYSCNAVVSIIVVIVLYEKKRNRKAEDNLSLLNSPYRYKNAISLDVTGGLQNLKYESCK